MLSGASNAVCTCSGASVGGPMSTHTCPSSISRGCIRPASRRMDTQNTARQPAGEGCRHPRPAERPELDTSWPLPKAHEISQRIRNDTGKGTGKCTCERVHAVCSGAVATVSLRNEARQATDAVAAHLWLAAVTVEDAHAVVRVAVTRRQRKDHLETSWL